MKNLILFLYTETATHAGTGTGLGAVDMPIQREVTTRYPVIQGTGVKGALRHQFTGTNSVAIFGPDTDNASDHAGSIMVGDARLLAFPVRSLKGVMAWVTCPDVLARFQRDGALARDEHGHLLSLPNEPVALQDETEAFPASTDTVLTGGTILLEEYAYRAKEDATTQKWAAWLGKSALPTTDPYGSYYKGALSRRLIVLRNDDFRDFTLYATQVITRIRIESSTKTVADGALFTQELLPADTLFYVPIGVGQERTREESPRTEDEIEMILKAGVLPRIQIGGDETTGRGFVALRWGA